METVYRSLQADSTRSKEVLRKDGKKHESPDWYDSEIATLIFGVIRLGDKDFTDLMNETVFIRNEIEAAGRPLYIGNKRRNPQEVARKWQQIKTLRNLDLNRFRAELSNSGKIVTEKDWMLSALLALTRHPEQDLN